MTSYLIQNCPCSSCENYDNYVSIDITACLKYVLFYLSHYNKLSILNIHHRYYLSYLCLEHRYSRRYAHTEGRDKTSLIHSRAKSNVRDCCVRNFPKYSLRQGCKEIERVSLHSTEGRDICVRMLKEDYTNLTAG